MTDGTEWTIDLDHPRIDDISDHSSDEELADYDNDCLQERDEEPTQSIASQDNAPQREGKLFWCHCFRCKSTTEMESFCCSESTLIRKHIPNTSDCITEQSLFKQIILDKDGLEFTRQVIGNSIPCPERRDKYLAVELTDSKFRNLAYKAFFSYIATKDERGQGERFVIPSCVVSAIREAFPSPTGKYSGYLQYKGRDALYFY